MLHPIDVTDGSNVTDAFFPLGLGLPFGHSFGLKTAVSDGLENVWFDDVWNKWGEKWGVEVMKLLESLIYKC